MQRPTNANNPTLPYLDFAYDHKASEKSARELVYRIQSKWRDHPEEIKIVQFKDGITNTVCAYLEQARALANSLVATEAC